MDLIFNPLSCLCKTEVTGIAKTPEHYLKFIKRIVKQAVSRTNSESSSRALKFNLGQCPYLAGKLKVAVDRAHPIFQYQLLHGAQSMKLKFLEIIKLLYGLAKEVESFINECCKDEWIQAAVMLTNMMERISSIGSSLELWAILFSDRRIWGATEGSLSLSELVKKVSEREIETVQKIAQIDKDVLLAKVKAYIQSTKSSSEDLHLVKHLDGLLGLIPARESSGLGFYELTDMHQLNQMESIGKGSAATVYRAKWLGVEVAKKTFCQSNFDEFDKEVSILAGLSHPNITPLLCYGKGKQECSIVMELMDEDLYSLIRKRLQFDAPSGFPFTLLEAVDIIFQVARGMYYLHEKNIVHRDLKSLNILVKYLKKTKLAELESEYVLAKVSDFGMSKTKESSTRYSNQTPNIGTTRWMAPEVILSISNRQDLPKYPFKADVYSFALVCYEILTGHEPFADLKPFEIRKRILNGEHLQLLLKLPDWCPSKLNCLIEKCWSPHASTRPCFGDICEVLRQLQCELSTTAVEELILAEFLPQIFTYQEVVKITDNFAQKLGSGSFSCVYLGHLPNNTKIAVKKLDDSELFGYTFLAAVANVGSISHLNLVSLRGFCKEGNHMILMYEFVNAGRSLDWYLFPSRNGSPLISAQTRRSIALGTARGLAHLHGGGNGRYNTSNCVLHGSVKPENIIVDTTMLPRLVDFGLVNLMSRSQSLKQAQVRGSLEYMAPEWSKLQLITEKADVYSLGIVILELVSGRRCFQQGVSQEESFLPAWGFYLLRSSEDKFPDRVLELVDPLLHVRFLPTTDQQVLKGMIFVALWCVQEDPSLRPTMEQVVRMLEGDVYVDTPPSRHCLALDAFGRELCAGYAGRGASPDQPQVAIHSFADPKKTRTRRLELIDQVLQVKEIMMRNASCSARR